MKTGKLDQTTYLCRHRILYLSDKLYNSPDKAGRRHFRANHPLIQRDNSAKTRTGKDRVSYVLRSFDITNRRQGMQEEVELTIVPRTFLV